MARRPVNRVIGLCHASSMVVGRLPGAAHVMIGHCDQDPLESPAVQAGSGRVLVLRVETGAGVSP